ncbi:MAG: APC family permease [Vulcanimicrobiota bacterium]
MNDSNKNKLKKALGLFDLILLNIVAIVGLRWTANAASIGPGSIILWLLAMLVFFIPSALVVMDLASHRPREGGIYPWTREACGDFNGFICGFFYWVNNIIYYPNLLIFLSGIFLYVGGARFLHLETNSLYFAIFSLVLLWIAIISNIVGLKTGKWLQNIGSAGTWITALVLIILAGIAWKKFGIAQDFSQNIMPDFKDLTVWAVFSNLCFSFAGMELQGCMGEEIDEPGKNIPRAIFISGIAIVLIYIFSTLALMVALPANEINVISGIVQVIARVAEKVNLVWMGPVIALFLTIGGLGGCGAWLAGTARIPFTIGIDNYLPEWFARIHPRWGTPVNALLAQGIFSSLFIIMAAVGSKVKESYMLLLGATVILYFIPYVYMFIDFLILRKKDGEIIMKTPAILGYIGILTTVFAIAMAIIPPPETKNVLLYELKLLGGPVFFFILAYFLYSRGRKKKAKGKTADDKSFLEGNG